MNTIQGNRCLKNLITSCLTLFFIIITIQPLNADIYPKPVVNLCPFMATTFSLQQPESRNIFESGTGFLLGIGAANIFLNHFYTQLSFDFELSEPQEEDMSFYNHYDIVLSTGYNFIPFHSFIITPTVGAGIIFHHDNNNLLYSPHVNASCIFDLNLIKNTFIFFSFDTSFQLLRDFSPIFRFQIGLKNHFQIPPTIPEKAKASIIVVPRLFSPDGDNHNDLAEIWLHVTSYCKIEQWDLRIYDPMHHPFYSKGGKETVPEKVIWDGYSEKGELVESTMQYYVELELYDEFNRRTEANAVINTDIIVLKAGHTVNVRIPGITFPPFSADLIIEDDEETTRKNQEILQGLADLFLTQYKEYNIRIEGHANHIDWMDSEKKQIEQETILLPLSLGRAKAVKDALIALGIEEERMSIMGMGGDVPIVPFDDVDNIWKNRRVEFVLERKK